MANWDKPNRARSQEDCRERFVVKVMEMRSEIGEIDAQTPWSEVEPKWWLEMMEIDKQLTQFLANRA